MQLVLDFPDPPEVIRWHPRETRGDYRDTEIGWFCRRRSLAFAKLAQLAFRGLYCPSWRRAEAWRYPET